MVSTVHFRVFSVGSPRRSMKRSTGNGMMNTCKIQHCFRMLVGCLFALLFVM